MFETKRSQRLNPKPYTLNLRLHVVRLHVRPLELLAFLEPGVLWRLNTKWMLHVKENAGHRSFEVSREEPRSGFVEPFFVGCLDLGLPKRGERGRFQGKATASSTR